MAVLQFGFSYPLSHYLPDSSHFLHVLRILDGQTSSPLGSHHVLVRNWPPLCNTSLVSSSNHDVRSGLSRFPTNLQFATFLLLAVFYASITNANRWRSARVRCVNALLWLCLPRPYRSSSHSYSPLSPLSLVHRLDSRLDCIRTAQFALHGGICGLHTAFEIRCRSRPRSHCHHHLNLPFTSYCARILWIPSMAHPTRLHKPRTETAWYLASAPLCSHLTHHGDLPQPSRIRRAIGPGALAKLVLWECWRKLDQRNLQLHLLCRLGDRPHYHHPHPLLGGTLRENMAFQ